MIGDQKVARIIMLKDMNKPPEDNLHVDNQKRQSEEDQPERSHHTMNTGLEKFGVDLSNPIVELTTETKELEL